MLTRGHDIYYIYVIKKNVNFKFYQYKDEKRFSNHFEVELPIHVVIFMCA